MAGHRSIRWLLFLLLLTCVGGSTTSDTSTLCGETERKETGYLNDLYFLLYRSRLEQAATTTTSNGSSASIPVLLWLSGGPGCSGVVAALFENGPCAFDEDKSEAVVNPFAWTSVAHVLYVDQPYGTGFSQHINDTQRPWTNFDAARNLHIFLDAFFARHRDLRSNPFFIIGESYGGHYAPDIAVRLLKLAPERWSGVLKGVGIGNGYTSPRATLASYLKYSQQNAYGVDFLSDWYAVSDFKTNLAACTAYIDNCSTDVPRVVSLASHCNDAQPCVDASNQFWSSLRYKGVNVFDVRKQCAKEDSASLCYHFSRLQDYVNTPEHRAYFGVTDQQPDWVVCSNAVEAGSSAPDYFLESEYEVAYLLDHGVPVLIYAGDADPVCNWMAQDQWTRDLKWKHAEDFNQAQLVSWPSEEVIQRSSHGLTFAKVRASGHVRHAITAICLCCLLGSL